MPIRLNHPNVCSFEGTFPEGFADVSYGNDVCASIYSSKLGLKVFIDHLLPRDREEPEYSRFSIYRANEFGETEELMFETEDFKDVETYINDY